jgi:hypothetical protein
MHGASPIIIPISTHYADYKDILLNYLQSTGAFVRIGILFRLLLPKLFLMIYACLSIYQDVKRLRVLTIRKKYNLKDSTVQWEMGKIQRRNRNRSSAKSSKTSL